MVEKNYTTLGGSYRDLGVGVAEGEGAGCWTYTGASSRLVMASLMLFAKKVMIPPNTKAIATAAYTL